MKPKAKDKSPVWLKNKHGIVSCVPKHTADYLMKDRNKGYEITEPDFVPKKKIKAYDDEKKAHVNKQANTEKTMTEIMELTKMKMEDLREYARENEVNIQGVKTKKLLLEKLEAAGKLY